MKLWYIKHLISVRMEKLKYTIAWMMPKWLVYYCSIRLIAHASTGKYSNVPVPEITAMDALKSWKK